MNGSTESVPAAPPDTRPKPFVFVLMPFESGFDDVYQLGIKPACSNVGAYAERVDEQVFQESMLQRIYNQIAKADIIVADMTGRNANVFYEVGYAHALGKVVILLTQNAEHIPFDLKHYSHIVYQGRISDLIPELERTVRWHIQNSTSPVTSSTTLEFYVNGTALRDRPTIFYPVSASQSAFVLKIKVHNSVDRAIREIDAQIGILSESAFNWSPVGDESRQVIELTDGRLLHLHNDLYCSLPPGGWEQKSATIVPTRRGELNLTQDYEFTLRAFLNSGPVDFPFVIRPVSKPRESIGTK